MPYGRDGDTDNDNDAELSNIVACQRELDNILDTRKKQSPKLDVALGYVFQLLSQQQQSIARLLQKPEAYRKVVALVHNECNTEDDPNTNEAPSMRVLVRLKGLGVSLSADRSADGNPQACELLYVTICVFV